MKTQDVLRHLDTSDLALFHRNPCFIRLDILSRLWGAIAALIVRRELSPFGQPRRRCLPRYGGRGECPYDPREDIILARAFISIAAGPQGHFTSGLRC